MGSLGDEPVSKESHDLKPEVHKAEESATQVHEPEADVKDVDIQSTEQGYKSEAQGADAQEAPEAGVQEAKGQDTEAQEAEVLKSEAQEAEAPKSSVQETEALKSEEQEAESPKSIVQETEALKSEAQEAEAPKSIVQETEALKSKAQEAEAPKSSVQETEALKSEAQETEAQEPETQEAEAQEAEAQETEAQEPETQEAEAQEAEVQEPEAQETGTSTTQNPNGVKQAGKLEQNVAAGTGDRAAPNGRRKLPEVKRFSARRSVVVAEDSKPAVESKSPSIARKQQRLSARMNMGIDDRDTVDYGAVTTEDLKPPPPVVAAVVVKEAPKQQQQLTVPERERLRLKGITRNKDIVCLERIHGKLVNITQGLELHTGVFSRVEQNKLVDLVRELQAKGRRQELKDRTFNEPRKWMRGKGRMTLQFGCCYNYSLDKDGNPPGILREDVVDPIPPLLRTTIKRLIRWHVLPPSCVPDSCIVNMYEEGDCIPPHIDHHDFLRPFCTLSLLSECNIVFGAALKVLGPGDFGGNLSLPLPVGSVLVLNGNGADVAKHAVPAVPTRRISITFRKMDPSKVPVGFTIDTELQSLKPVSLPS